MAAFSVQCRTISRSSVGGASRLAQCSSVNSRRRAMGISPPTLKGTAIAIETLSAKRPFTGRSPFGPETTLDSGEPDRMIVGRQNGRVREICDGPDWLCAGFDGGAGRGSPARCASRRRLRPDFRGSPVGSKDRSPGLAQALAFVREGDVLVTWNLIASRVRSHI